MVPSSEKSVNTAKYSSEKKKIKSEKKKIKGDDYDKQSLNDAKTIFLP